jgi:hypothetical protein
MNDSYLDPQLNRELGEKLFYSNQTGNEIQSFRRRRGLKRGNYQQVLLRNILWSYYKMKNANFKNT